MCLLSTRLQVEASRVNVRPRGSGASRLDLFGLYMAVVLALGIERTHSNWTGKLLASEDGGNVMWADAGSG